MATREVARAFALLALLAAAGSARAGEDPFEAFRAGRFEQAAREFARLRAERPADPALEINLGSALYELGRFEQAAAAFERANVPGAAEAIRQQASYGLGNAAYRRGRYDLAVRAYEEALRLDPTDADAAFNLELARRKLQAPPPPPPPSSPPSSSETGEGSTGGTPPPPDDESSPPAAGEESKPHSLTRQEAERLLSTLEDSAPPRPSKRGGQSRPPSGKDW